MEIFHRRMWPLLYNSPWCDRIIHSYYYFMLWIHNLLFPELLSAIHSQWNPACSFLNNIFFFFFRYWFLTHSSKKDTEREWHHPSLNAVMESITKDDIERTRPVTALQWCCPRPVNSVACIELVEVPFKRVDKELRVAYNRISLNKQDLVVHNYL